MYARAALLIVLILPLRASAQSYSEANLKGQKLWLRQTLNNNRKVYVRAGGQEAYYIHSVTRLFPVRKPEAVAVTGVSQKPEFVEVAYTSQYLGNGKIRIYHAASSDLFDASIRSAFAPTSEEALPALVLNKKTGVVHFEGSNHLSGEADTEKIAAEALQTGGYKKCPLCFSNIPRVSSYELEMRLGEGVTGQIHTRYPLVTDDAVQNRVRAMGERILGRWITPLKGYHYKFYAIDSDLTNAFACPAGKIYITTALLDSLESDEELEAVLAHEIAHVEMRHGYRQFRTAQKAAFWGGLAAAIAGVATKNEGVFQLANVISQLATAIVLTGHSRQYEAEADAFANIYFETNEIGQGRLSFRSALRKLQYHQDFYDPESTGSSFMTTHPGIEARIDAIEKSTMRAFGPDETFFGYDRDGELVATLTFQGQRCYTGTLNKDDIGLQLVALVETTSVLGDKDKIKEIKIKTKGKTIRLDNKEDTEVLPNDAVGASFVSKDQRALVEEIDEIELQLKNVASWRRAKDKG